LKVLEFGFVTRLITLLLNNSVITLTIPWSVSAACKFYAFGNYS